MTFDSDRTLVVGEICQGQHDPDERDRTRYSKVMSRVWWGRGINILRCTSVGSRFESAAPNCDWTTFTRDQETQRRFIRLEAIRRRPGFSD